MTIMYDNDYTPLTLQLKGLATLCVDNAWQLPTPDMSAPLAPHMSLRRRLQVVACHGCGHASAAFLNKISKLH
jgi:hypothetical protein